MANTPNLRSKEQIAGELIDSFLARLRKDIDLNQGSVITQLIEAVAQANFKSSASIIGMIDAQSIDRANGEALQRLARDRNVPIFPAEPSSGTVNITDTSFEKISSRIYSGQPAPVAGSLTIFVADASKFKSTNGQIYIGRGTTNVEGPLSYVSVQPEAGGAYWSITLAATSPTTKFHNIGETVVLAQGGNRVINTNTTVKTAQGASVSAVEFKTKSSATIIDGETTVIGVPVKATSPGEIGNVPRGAIKEAVGLPFPATVFNPNPYTNGRDADTEDQIRARIKAFEQAKAKGTATAIEFSANGVVAKDELKKVTSAKIVNYSDNSAALIFDDGSGYEPNFIGAPFETIVDQAIGGETEIQLRQKPIAQARVTNVIKAPYNIVDLSLLTVEVNGEETSHQFKSSEFKVPSSATSFEITASINSNPNINFNASTANNGTNLVIYPRDVSKNTIRIKDAQFGTDANDVLGFPKNEVVTIRLYKNDRPLFLDGVVAKVFSRAKSAWSTAITSGDTLKYIVDNTTEITAQFFTSDFQRFDSQSTMSATAPLEVWAKVLNSKMPGVVVTILGEQLIFTSARGNANDAAIQITGGTLLTQMFDVTADLSSSGRQPDFTINRQTGQIGFTESLLPGDRITAGSQYARGNVTTANIPGGPGAPGRMWVVVDGDSEAIPNNLKPNTQVSFSKTGTKLTINATSPLLTPEGFELARKGDWILVWANNSDNQALKDNQGFWRIEDVGQGFVTVDDGTIVRSNLNVVFTPLASRIVVVRTEAPLQEFDFVASPLSDFVSSAQSQLVGVTTEIVGGRVRFSTSSQFDAGEIFIAAVDEGGQPLGLPIGVAFKNTPSHYGFVAKTDSEVNLPSFTHGILGAANTDSTFTEPSYEDLGGDRDEFIEIASKPDLTGNTEVPESSKRRRAFVKDFNPVNNRLTLIPPSYMDSATIPTAFNIALPGFAKRSPIQEGDRYFLRSVYKFDSTDSMVAIADGDTTLKTYTLPVARKIKVSANSTPTNQDFSASDLESNLAMKDLSSFYDFSFDDFKVFRQAYAILSDGTYSIKVKSVDFGPSGNRNRVGLVYPESINSTTLQHKFSTSEVADIKIQLPVTTPRIPNWDYTTAFTVSKTTVGAKDVLTYTWVEGTQPDFSNAGADIHVGDIVFIGGTDFLPQNKNLQARVISVTPTSFTVELPRGASSSDALTFSDILNVAGTTTIETATPHGLSTGQRVGLYNTAISFGLNRPLNGTYIVNVLSPTSFQIQTPIGTPGAAIQSGIHTANTITLTTATPHNLTVGNIILVSGVGSGAYNGLASVSAVLSPNQFQYLKAGSSPAISNSGRVDFQSFALGPVTDITNVTKAGSLVTVNTSASHNLTPGDVVSIQSLDIQDWDNLTTYGVNDLVEFAGQLYISLVAGNVNNQPNINPASWQITTLDLSGSFIVNTTPTATQFTYIYSTAGNSAATGGTVTKFVPQGGLGRALGGQTDENLQFAEVSTTAQEVVDYITTNISSKVTAQITNGNGSAIINKSTADNDLISNYISANVEKIYTKIASRSIRMATDILIKKGSDIEVTGLTATQYNGSYVVINSYFDTTLSENIIELQSSTIADATAEINDAGLLTGSTRMVMMQDGENSVRQTDLDALIGFPMFTLKQPWATAPDIDEELRLVAVTADHLNRFWNKLVVTGLSNVGDIQLANYGRQLQISTKLFGGAGSIQIAGGTSNKLDIALVDAGQEIDSKLGSFLVPFDIKKGLVPRQWLKVFNTVRQNKDLGLDETTSLKLWNDGIEIGSGNGSFQTARNTTQSANTQIKVEKHGDFLAFIGVGGPSMNLQTAGVREGDWVRIRNINAAPWVNTTTYPLSARVNFAGRNYTSLISGNLNNQPNTSPAAWQVQEFDKSNAGIFQIVRIFGEDTFYIQNLNGTEETVILGNAQNLSFYSYDSVMPGDVLVINSTLFGAQNIGRYVVTEETSFPLPNRIWTQPISNPSPGFVVLGGEFAKFNVEEEKPLTLWKRIFAIGPASDTLASVIVDTPELVNKISSSLGAGISAQGKLGFNQDINFGIDAYKYYIGLIKELNKIIYGDSSDPINYPGVRAAGTDIDIKEGIIRRITASFSVRVKSGVPFTEIRDRVKSAVAGYVNSLGVGESVSISRMVAAANSIPGVVAVSVTFPQYSVGNDLISVSSFEKALVVDPTVDITVSVI